MTLIEKFYAMEPELREVANDLSDPPQPAVANVVRAIDQLHSIDAYYAGQQRPPLTPAKQAVADQDAAREAAAAKRHAAARADQEAREAEAQAAGVQRREAVEAKRAARGAR